MELSGSSEIVKRHCDKRDFNAKVLSTQLLDNIHSAEIE